MSEIGVREAARLLGVHENTVRNWASRGLLPFTRRPLGQLRFESEDLERRRAVLMGKKYISSYDREAPTPPEGSRWVWRIDQPRARQIIEVLEVVWNGEEWWVRTQSLPDAPEVFFGDLREPSEHWNDLSVFWEAVVPVGSAVGDAQ